MILKKSKNDNLFFDLNVFKQERNKANFGMMLNRIRRQ